MLSVRLGCEDGEEGRHRLLSHDVRRGCAGCAGRGSGSEKCRGARVGVGWVESSERFRKEQLQVALKRVLRLIDVSPPVPDDAARLHFTAKTPSRFNTLL